MQISIKGKTIVLSRESVRDVPGAFYIMMNGMDDILIDAKKGQKTYKLPKGFEKKDMKAFYLRMM